MRDSVEMEWAGIPAVAVLHEALAGSADAMLSLSGMQGYPYVKVRFPVPPSALWSPEVCAAVADAVVPEIVGRLTAPAGGTGGPPGDGAPVGAPEAG